MIIGMPISTFLAILIWPFVYIVAAIIDYIIMAKQDAQIDDSEFEEHLEPKHHGRKEAAK
jgi:hypothetical protein